jgi:cytochrome c5
VSKQSAFCAGALRDIIRARRAPFPRLRKARSFLAIPEETMSEHHTDLVEENIETHPVKLAVAILVGALAMILGLAMIASYAVGAWGQRSAAEDPAMSSQAIARRIAPVAKLVVDPNAPATPAAPVAPAAAKPAAVAAVTVPSTAPAAQGGGESTYKAICTACHSAGVAGAPKTGDKAAWAPRVAAGAAALYASAIKGKGAMPPKGGNAALSDADVKAAVDYMVAAAK